jgi:outer membrane receptor protein involved in Fe transport
MRKYTVLLFLFAGLTSIAQDFAITGTVIDAAKQPVAYANAALFNSNDSTLSGGGITNEAGVFAFTAPAGNYYLEISFISYQNKTVPVNNLTGNIDLGEVTLLEDAEVLDAVIIEGERSQMQLSLDKRVFEVGKDLSNISASAADVLDNVPSIDVDADGNINLRGSANARILINGRQSGLTGINVADAMRQLQGNMIERVEIITNPSSRYDAEGGVGIINIILKKEKSTAGSFSLNAGYPTNYGGSFNVSLRKKKFNYFAGYGVSFRSMPGTGSSLQSFQQGDSAFSYTQQNDRIREGISHNARAGADITLRDGSTLTVGGLIRLSDGVNQTTNLYEDFGPAGDAVRRMIRYEREEEPELNLEGSLSYQKEFEKEDHVFSFDVKWIDNVETEMASFEQTDVFLDSTGFQRSTNTENERNILVQSDYVLPFGENSRFETGVKGTMRMIGNDFLVEQLNDESGQWSGLAQLDNDLTYRENIYAAYAMIGTEHGKFSWQSGARVELSDIDIDLLNRGTSSEQLYLNVFPSAHLSYVYKQNRTFQLSYSYRLNRPSFRDLVPFSNYSDNRSIQLGNPNLRPEYTHSMEAGHLLNWDKGSFLSNIYYRYRTGVVEEIASVDSLAVTSTIPVNLATQKAYGLELNATLNPTDNWRINGNANFYRAITDGTYLDQLFFSDTYTMTSRLTSQVTVFKHWNVQAGLNYRAPRITTQGRDLAIAYADLGLSRDVLRDNGTITLSVRDVFNSRRYRSVINREDIGYYSERNFQWRPRQFLLTFTYRLNMKNADTRSVDDERDDADDS